MHPAPPADHEEMALRLLMLSLIVAVARVRRLLGEPDERARAGGELCWDYGTPLSKGGMYAVCFRRGKVSYKSRA